jgi:hypothetical protein
VLNVVAMDIATAERVHKMTAKKDDRGAEADVDAWVEEAAAMLEAMAKELRRLKKVNRPTEERRQKVEPKGDKGKKKGFQVGDRVELVRAKDPLARRQGVILSRRGSMYWHVRLDGDPKIRWRMDSSLRRVDNN